MRRGHLTMAGPPAAGPIVSLRQLNRWTLARQMLLERVEADAVSAIERLAGMQAQHPPSPYIGLWSRIRDFRREQLEAAVRDSLVVKATLMRGTLHLVSSRQFDQYRVASRHRNPHLARALRLLAELGMDSRVVRDEIEALLRQRPHSRAELLRALAHRIPAGMPEPLFFGVLHHAGGTINVPEDAAFGHSAGSRYRLAPPVAADPETALRTVVAAYLRAFGPASRADIAQWLGQPAGVFGSALAALDTVAFQSEDGRLLLDMVDAPRPDPGERVAVRFLPRWDNVLLAHERRERVLPEPLRRVVIRKNGDVLPTFLVDGVVAGTWQAASREPTTMTLTPLTRLRAAARSEVAREADDLLAWLHPDAPARAVRWSPG